MANLKQTILDNQGREWEITCDVSGEPFETDDGKGRAYTIADPLDLEHIFLEIKNDQGKCVHIQYFKNLDDMVKTGQFDKPVIAALKDVAEEKVLQDQEWKQCGHDLTQ